MQNISCVSGRMRTVLGLIMMGGLSVVGGITPANAAPTYVVKAQVVEGANLARSLMTFVADEYAYLGRPTVYMEGGSGKYVDHIVVNNGRIDITYGRLAHASIANKTLSITPYVTSDQNLVWRCGNNPEPPELQLPEGTGYQASDIADNLTIQACANIDATTNIASYRGDIIRGQVGQGLILAEPAKVAVVEGAVSALDILAAAQTWNSQNSNRGAMSQYVDSVIIDPNTGMIMMTYNPNIFMGSRIWAGAYTLVLTPFVYVNGSPIPLGVAVAAGLTGPVDWSCSSATSTVAYSRGLIPLAMGTLPAKYAPPECR